MVAARTRAAFDLVSKPNCRLRRATRSVARDTGAGVRREGTVLQPLSGRYGAPDAAKLPPYVRFNSRFDAAAGMALPFGGFLRVGLFMTDVPKDGPLPDAYLREIGRTAVEWSKVEAAIEVLIWTFLFVDHYQLTPWFREPEGRAVTTHVNILLRLDMMLSLASATASMTLQEIHPPFERLEILAKDARALVPKRNKCVHGLWSPVGKMALRQSYRARGDVSPLYDMMTLEDLKDVADQCADLAARAQAQIKPLSAYLQELRTTWFERGRE